MTHSRRVAAAASLIWILGTSAEACVVFNAPKLADAREADAIVVGDVTTYETKPDGARVTLEVDGVISGKSPSTITIFWPEGLNNGPPDQFRGGFLFVLKKPVQADAAVGTDYIVTSDVCTPAMVFRRGSAQANAIREMFGLYAEPLEIPPKTFSDIISSIPWPSVVAYSIIAFGAGLLGLAALWPRRSRRSPQDNAHDAGAGKYP